MLLMETEVNEFAWIHKNFKRNVETILNLFGYYFLALHQNIAGIFVPFNKGGAFVVPITGNEIIDF